MPLYKKILALITWVIPAVLKLSFFLLGIPIVGFYSRNPQIDWPRWTWIWQNKEDGGDPLWYADKYPSWPPWFRRWIYSAFRNPINNHRYLIKEPPLTGEWGYMGNLESKPMQANNIRQATRWQQAGIFFSYRRLTLLNSYQYREIFIGWKIDMGVPGFGFTTQNRKGTIGN